MRWYGKVRRKIIGDDKNKIRINGYKQLKYMLLETFHSIVGRETAELTNFLFRSGCGPAFRNQKYKSGGVLCVIS
jgi:hypothetical protein